MARKPSVQIIGSLNIDFTIFTSRLPRPGETLTASALKISAGGKGANQAMACGRAAYVSHTTQDVTVEIIGGVGEGDPYYSSLLQPSLIKSGVGTGGIEEIKGVPTGTAMITVDQASHGQNRILLVPGANGAVIETSKVLATSRRNGYDPTVVVMQGEIPRATVLELLTTFNLSDSKTAVIFNPAPVFPDGVPLECLEKLAVLVVNETEWLQVLLALRMGPWNEDNPRAEPDIDESHLDQYTARMQETANISIILVTLGARGVYYSAPGGSVRGVLPAHKVDNPLDTTAAGDTFIGYFAVELARHLFPTGGSQETFDVKAALTRANAAAAWCVQRRGAMDSIPFAFELDSA